MPFSGDYDGSIVLLLEQLRLTADLEGIAVLDMSEDTPENSIAYCVGIGETDTIDLGKELLADCPNRPSHGPTPGQRSLMACPWVLPPARLGGVLMWRASSARSWTEADHDLTAATVMLLRCAIGAGMGQPSIDRLTSLPNRRWFLDEGDRHIDRLDQDGLVGTLVLIDVVGPRSASPPSGREHGDRAMVRMSSYLRAMVRPSDIVARVGPDEFALWLDGMDHLTAAERAEALCSKSLFGDWPDSKMVTVSIGIASRRAGGTEDIRTLLRRAHVAVREVKAKGGSGWYVSQSVPLSRLSGSSV